MGREQTDRPNGFHGFRDQCRHFPSFLRRALCTPSSSLLLVILLNAETVRESAQFPVLSWLPELSTVARLSNNDVECCVALSQTDQTNEFDYQIMQIVREHKLGSTHTVVEG